MFLTLQFPFADVRRFFRGDDAYLRSPNWPTPEVDRQFVRYFGPVRNRLLGGSGAKWMGDELFYCNARHALRLPDLRADSYPPWGSLRRVLRRLFFHKPALARVEVAFAIMPSANNPLTGNDVLLRIGELLTLNTWVPEVADGKPASIVPKSAPLILQGRRLARLLLRATTPLKAPPHVPVEDWAVRDGEPMLLVEYGRDELRYLPNVVRHLPVTETNGFSIGFTTTQFRGRSVVIWFLEASPMGESKLIRRSLRMCLLRLHLEFQALGIILNTISDRSEFDYSTASNKGLEAYLDEATRRLFKRVRFGISQTPLYTALAAHRELISAERRALLLNKLEDVRGQVLQRVEKATRLATPAEVSKALGIERGKGGVTLQVLEIGTLSLSGEIYMDASTTNVNVTNSVVQGNLVVAKQVIDSFKTDSKNQSLAGELDNVRATVEQLVTKLPPADQEQVSRRLISLTEEATSPNPDKQEVKGLGQKIIETAGKVDSMVGPVTTAVQAVLNLFGV
jgi:hypothetical protein